MAEAARKLTQAPMIEPLQLRMDGFAVTDIKGVVDRFALPLADEPVPMYGEQWVLVRVRKVRESDEGRPGTDGRPVLRTDSHSVIAARILTESQAESLGAS